MTLRSLPTVLEGASIGYLRSFSPYRDLTLSLKDRYAPRLRDTDPLFKGILLLSCSLQLPFIFQGFSQHISTSMPGYQKELNLAKYVMLGLGGISVTANLLQSYLVQKSNRDYSQKLCTVNNYLNPVYGLGLFIANLASLAITGYSAYKTRQLREWSILGTNILGTLSAFDCTASLFKVAGPVLKFSGCYFAKNKVEQVALGVWGAFSMYQWVSSLSSSDGYQPV